jgi:hypothetical protein
MMHGVGLNQNQRNVATALNTFFNNGGALPPGFLGLFNLTGGNLANARRSRRGKPRPERKLTSQFLGLMLDP